MAASKYSVLEGEVRDLLENGLGKFLTDLTDGRGQHQPSIVLGQQLSKAFRSYYDLKAKLDKDKLDCAVLALTKSGKSTFLNALCGASILPSNNVPETARIVALEHYNLEEEGKSSLKYKVKGEVVEVEGEEQIRCHLEILNKNVRGRQHSKDDEQIITVRTQLAALQTEPQDLAVGLRLLDTPGPNEAGEDALRHSVERLLDSVDAVVYLLDYTKLKTQEEADLLSKLSKSNPQLIMRLAQRLFFVVNKIDVMHTSEGLQEDELREYVADLVTKQMNFASFQLRPEQVLLVSAEDALLSRLVLSDKATPRQRERFARKQFGRNSRAKLSEKEYLTGALSLLDESRIMELEDCLLSYLYNEAGSLKILSLLDGIAKLLTQMKNVAVTAEAAMKVSSGTLTAEVENLKSSLATTSEEFKAVQRQASGVETDVINNVQERMLNLKDRLFLHIEQVLDPSGSPQPAEPQQLSGWGHIRAKCTAFLSRSKAQESTSDAALKAKLSDLHSDIKKQIETEITDFWHELETATNQTYQELIAVINQHLLELARKIEGSVGKVLDLCLKPLDICLQRPSAEEFHTSVQDLLRNGIKHGKRREIKHREEDHVEWQKRYRGICNHSEYYVGIPVKRRTTYHEDVPVFSLDPDSIKVYFHDMVEQSISISINNVKDYVHLFMSDQIEKAHAKISSYSSLYADAMTAALTAKTLSAFEQNANVEALKENIAAVEELLGKANHIAQTANNLFPQLEIDSYDWVVDSDRGSQEMENNASQAASKVDNVSMTTAEEIIEDLKQQKAFATEVPQEFDASFMRPLLEAFAAEKAQNAPIQASGRGMQTEVEEEGADPDSETDYGQSEVSEDEAPMTLGGKEHGKLLLAFSESSEESSEDSSSEVESSEVESSEDELDAEDEDESSEDESDAEDEDSEDEDVDGDYYEEDSEEDDDEEPLCEEGFQALVDSQLDEFHEAIAQNNGPDVQTNHPDTGHLETLPNFHGIVGGEGEDDEIVPEEPPVVAQPAPFVELSPTTVFVEPPVLPSLPLSDLPDLKHEYEEVAIIDHQAVGPSPAGSSSDMKSAQSAPLTSDHDSSDWEHVEHV